MLIIWILNPPCTLWLLFPQFCHCSHISVSGVLFSSGLAHRLCLAFSMAADVPIKTVLGAAEWLEESSVLSSVLDLLLGHGCIVSMALLCGAQSKLKMLSSCRCISEQIVCTERTTAADLG